YTYILVHHIHQLIYIIFFFFTHTPPPDIYTLSLHDALPIRDSPGNQGRLCVKGRYGWDYALHEQRLTRPLIRRPEFYPKGPLSPEVRGNGDGRRGGGVVDYAQVMPAFREATWEEALDLVAGRLRAIKEAHGPGAL